MKNKILLSSLFVLISTPALAFDISEVQKNQSPLAAEFAQLDDNKDEKLSRAEAGKDSLFTAQNFAKADKNKDGKLNLDEFSRFKSADQQKKTGQALDDSAVTTKVKSKIFATKGLKSYQISVETYKGEVILSGFVDSAEAKTKAGQVAASVSGVKSVKNSLEVKN